MLDYLAVWSLTAALLLSAPAVLYLSHLSPLRSVRVVALVAGAGAVLAGLTNAAEDALRLPLLGSGDVFLVGSLVFVAGLLACTAILAMFRCWRLATVFALWCAGMVISVGVPGAGLLILVALVAVAAKPTWFTMKAAARPGEHPTPGH